MGLFRRRHESESSSGPAATPSAAAAVQRAPEGAWETAPAMQRTIGPAPTTFRTATVNSIMPTHQNPSLSGSMGHNVSDDGPSGFVDGLTTTIDPGDAVPPVHD